MRELNVNNKLEIIDNITPVEFIDGDNDNDFIAGITKEYHDPIYTDPEQLQNRIVKYFNRLLKQEKKPTITGLVLYLGYCSRQSFYDMCERSSYPLIAYTIKRAKQLIENWYEEGLHDNKRVTGSIFALKNMGWYDNQKIDLGLENLLKAPRLTDEEVNQIALQVKSKL